MNPWLLIIWLACLCVAGAFMHLFVICDGQYLWPFLLFYWEGEIVICSSGNLLLSLCIQEQISACVCL